MLEFSFSFTFSVVGHFVQYYAFFRHINQTLFPFKIFLQSVSFIMPLLSQCWSACSSLFVPFENYFVSNSVVQCIQFRGSLLSFFGFFQTIRFTPIFLSVLLKSVSDSVYIDSMSQLVCFISNWHRLLMFSSCQRYYKTRRVSQLCALKASTSISFAFA